MVETGLSLVSIVVTSYNHAEYLPERMDSLLAQTYTNLEINVVDDCSTDDSVEVLAHYESDPRVRLTLLKQNVGYAQAGNLGVSLSKGEYIMFAECDDFSSPRHVETLMAALLANETAGVAFCRSNMVDSRGCVFGDDFAYRERSFKKLCTGNTLLPQKEIRKFFLRSCVIPNMSSAIIRKRYIMQAGGFDSRYKACADWDFWCRLSRYCNFFYVTEPLNNFRTHSSTVRNTTVISSSVLEIYDILYREYATEKLSLIEHWKFRMAMGAAWAQYIVPEPGKWLKSLSGSVWKAMRYDRLIVFFLSLAVMKKILIFTGRRLFGKTGGQRRRVTF